MRKSFTHFVMGATALSSIVSSAAWADEIPTPGPAPADSATLSEMQNQCDALAAAHDTGNGDIWAGVVMPGSAVKIAGPTEVEGTRDIDEATIQHAGTYTPGELEIRGDPFRIGGSVNMFGDQWSTAGMWSDSTYNYTADFLSTFRHSFTCDITQSVFHAAHTEHHNAVGVYVIAGDFGASEDAVRGDCAAFTAQGLHDPQPDWFGEPFHGGNPNNPHCQFEGTPASDVEIPDTWDLPVVVATEAGTPVDQDQTDSLYAYEDHGGPVQAEGEFHVGQVVICISPSTTLKKGVPGAWRQQNGYLGAKCTTDWFKVAPWGAGTENSNGTYISVPDYTL